MKADGNVGIGTTSPNNKLDVNGGIVCSPNTDGKDTFELSTHAANEGRLSIKNVDTKTVQIRAGGDTYFNGGNVGIGTDSPDQLLHINKATGTTLFKASVAGNSTIGLEIQKTGSTTQSWRIADGQTVNGKLEFYDVTDSATRMCIDGSGNVGIGGTAPNYQLHATTSVGIGGHGLSNQQLSLNNQEIQSLNLGVGYTALHLNKLGAHVHIGASNADVRLSLCSTGTAGTNDSNWIRGEANVLSFNAAAANAGGFQYEVAGTKRHEIREVTTGVTESKWTSGYATYADDAQSSTFYTNTNCFVAVSAWKSAASTNYPAALYHVPYTGDVTLISKSADIFSTSNVDGKIVVYRVASGEFRVYNRVGVENRIAVTILHFMGV
tara:strand:- start:281 stop:1420 length:1140 start_codon:yes stop_codon:yes gene_type:complete